MHHRAGNFLVCAGSTFSDPEPQSTSIDVQQHDITKAIESTDVVAKEKQPTTKPPPYSWTQSSDSVTIAFPLPSNTLKSHIHVTIAPKHLSILIKDLLDINSDSDEADEPPKETFPLPRYAMKELWEYVDVVNSLWTWDKEGGRTVGLLTLHLEKRHEGVKWAHVFSREGTSENDPEVPETVDPSELANIREALEKYTSELQEGTAGSLPSLAQGEMDPSVDTEVGRRSTVSAFDVMTGDEVAPNTAFAEVLSFPLPVDATRAVGIVSEVNTYSLTIKSGIDGPLFAGPVLPNVDAWEHVSTFPAMGFVLASKRDKKFIFHVGSSHPCLALDLHSRIDWKESRSGVGEWWKRCCSQYVYLSRCDGQASGKAGCCEGRRRWDGWSIGRNRRCCDPRWNHARLFEGEGACICKRFPIGRILFLMS